jgi:hypothetical protein
MSGIDSTAVKGLGVGAPILVVERPKRGVFVFTPCALVFVVIAIAIVSARVPALRETAWFGGWAYQVGEKGWAAFYLALVVAFVATVVLATWYWEERPRSIEIYEDHIGVLSPSKIESVPWSCFTTFDDGRAGHVDLHPRAGVPRAHGVRIWTRREHDRAVVLELVTRKGLARVER